MIQFTFVDSALTMPRKGFRHPTLLHPCPQFHVSSGRLDRNKALRRVSIAEPSIFIFANALG